MNEKKGRVAPGPGQESVWDYPRPPRIEATRQALRVVFAGETIAAGGAAFRVLETSHPPVFYLPPSSVALRFLTASPGTSYCEFKGSARYWSLDVHGRRSEKAGWSYPNPTEAFAEIRDCIAFYASRVDECWVDGERVVPQAGDFYGGWITSGIVGPFKGPPGTRGW